MPTLDAELSDDEPRKAEVVSTNMNGECTLCAKEIDNFYRCLLCDSALCGNCHAIHHRVYNYHCHMNVADHCVDNVLCPTCGNFRIDFKEGECTPECSTRIPGPCPECLPSTSSVHKKKKKKNNKKKH